MTDCAHVWVANSGRGGEPEFRLNRTMSSEPLMHVMCPQCGDRTWLTRARWEALAPEAEAPEDRR